MVVNIATRAVVHEIALGGQPDSIAISKDGKYVAVVIENERDEDLGDGTPPQLPGGKLVIVDTVGAPNTWQTRDVALTNLAMLYPTDPEPEYVSINDNNVAVVTLQENNHIVLVDLATGKVTRDFTAGKVSLTQIDLTDAPRPNQVNLTESLSDRLREPDGVTWVSTSQFVTANEGDLDGGSRGFTLFNTDGSVAYDAGNTMEHLMARIGHTNDKRSDAKGNEPENVAAGRFDRTDYLFVASERSSVLAVYDLSSANQPTLKQVLPSAQAPEGVLTIPSRNLVITASEETDPRWSASPPSSQRSTSTSTRRLRRSTRPSNRSTAPMAPRSPGQPCPDWLPRPPARCSTRSTTPSSRATASSRSTPASRRPSCNARSASPIRTA